MNKTFKFLVMICLLISTTQSHSDSPLKKLSISEEDVIAKIIVLGYPKAAGYYQAYILNNENIWRYDYKAEYYTFTIALGSSENWNNLYGESFAPYMALTSHNFTLIGERDSFSIMFKTTFGLNKH